MTERFDGLEFIADPNAENPKDRPNAVASVLGGFLFMRLPAEAVLISIGGETFSRQWFPEIDGNDIAISIYCRVTSDGVEIIKEFSDFLIAHGITPAVLRGRERARFTNGQQSNRRGETV
jgi:hypothetical protein